MQRHLREIHLAVVRCIIRLVEESSVEQGSQQGFEPSHGRLVITHWSHACLEVVARLAEVEPLRLLFGALEGFSAE